MNRYKHEARQFDSIMIGFTKTKRAALVLALVVLACLSLQTESFSSPSTLSSLVQQQRSGRSSLVVVRDSTEEESTASSEATEKISLEDKMKSWEASEEEIRAASLGGVIPQGRGERTGAFDVGLYIAFPIMVLTGLAFALFPFIMGNIDVSDIVVPTE